MPEPTPPNPGQSDDDKDTSGAPDGDKNKPDMIRREEAEKSFKERDKLKEEKRRLQAEFDAYKTETGTQLSEFQTRLKEIEDGKTAAEEEAAKKSGNIEQLQKTWEAKQADLQKQIETERKAREKEVREWQEKHDGVSTRYQRNLVERTLLEELTSLSTNPKGELVFFQKEFEFEAVHDDDGRFTGIKPKDSEKTVADLHKEICEKYGLPFEKNDRANGSGAQPVSGDGGNAATRLPANFDKKSKEEQQKWFKENPNFKPW